MTFDPISAAASLDEAYRTYLASTLRFGDPNLQGQFEKRMLQRGALSKGPLLEATPPYMTGRSIRELVSEGVLSEGMLRLEAELPANRPLYTHQESAIRGAASGRNQAVVTGTGSGKTECFLLPIIDHLLRQHAAGELGPGVRALILYPMNALANDQLKRLRTLLASVPEVTFGRYTGETKASPRDARKAWSQQHPGVEPAENELLSREAIRDTPPHILLTNYAMLEYLLLRPSDAPIFEGMFGRSWSHVVVDEAHVYSGTLGTEIAYLLRRLKARLGVPKGNLRCFATSATIGSTTEDHRQVARFASDLFGEPFGDGVDEPLDVVTSIPDSPQAEFRPNWGEIESAVWAELAGAVAQEEEPTIAQLGACLQGRVPDSETALLNSVSGWRSGLGQILLGETTTQSLIARLSEGALDVSEPDTWETLGETLSVDTLSQVVQVLSRCQRIRGSQLLSARYHSFFRAPEGAFLSLLDPPELFLTRRRSIEGEEGQSPVFEVSTCRHCGQEYILGHRGTPDRNGSGEVVQALLPELPRESDDEDLPEQYYMLLLNRDIDDSPVDEDQTDSAGAVQMDLPQWLCPVCGSLHESSDSRVGHLWEHEPVRMVAVRETKARGDRRPCVKCGYQSARAIQRVRVSPEAAGSVMVYDLVRSLPPMEGVPILEQEQDDWYAGPAIQPGSRAGNLICFSDRRQDAAFFAPSLERTYGSVTRRQVLFQVARMFGDDRFTPSDWAKGVAKAILSDGLVTPKPSVVEARKVAWAWVLTEMMSEDGRASLEGLGLVSYRVRDLDLLPVTPLQRAPWELSEAEARSLVERLIGTLRDGRAIAWQEGIARSDELMPEHWMPVKFVRERTGRATVSEKSWLPSGPGVSNARVDFGIKALDPEMKASEDSRKEVKDVMAKIWAAYLWADSSPLKQFLDANGDQMGGWLQASPDLWEIEAEPSDGFKRCGTCGRLVVGSALPTCPTYRCRGALQSVNPDDDPVDAFYRRVYRNDQPLPISVEEHTGQLRNQEAARIQERFIRGEVNVLSCTTTFELGVDVGDLHSVFMRNVPPSPANYVQRAGRTGRRTGTPGYALTFARLRSHDLVFYKRPTDMISGRIPAPACYLNNEKIAERHVFAVGMSAFFRSRPDREKYCGSVADFFDPGEVLAPGIEELKEYLSQRPAEITEALPQILPADVSEAICGEDWLWVEHLVGDEGRIGQAKRTINQDWGDLCDEKAYRLEHGGRVDWIGYAQERILREQVISRLASHGALPKYGFPTDLVELVLPREIPESSALEMQRGLRMAIYEYAPGSEVVAFKKIWRSVGLRRIPGRDWEIRSYWACRECGHFHTKIGIDDSSSNAECSVCGADMGFSSTYVVPEFGFAARLDKKGVGEKRPRAAGGARTYFERPQDVDAPEPTLLPGGVIRVWYARDARLHSINRGPMGSGFKICPSCGGAGPTAGPKDVHMRKGCTATLRGGQHLGTHFLTDALEIAMKPNDIGRLNKVAWEDVLSALWSCVLTAARMLMVPEAEIGGTAYRLPGGQLALLLFDDVPGGAGRVQSLADRAEELLQRARDRVAGDCGCGEDTSCYACLRSYQNQWMHDDLSRAGAIRALDAILLE